MGNPAGILHSAAPGMQEESTRDKRENAADDAKTFPIIADCYLDVVGELIRTAKRSIDICAYTWKWYAHQGKSAIQGFNRLIIDRARQGLPIRARLNHESKDHYLTKENTRTASELRRYGVQVKFDGT